MRALIAATLVAFLLQLAPAGADDGPEECLAFHPIVPTCSYTVTHTSQTPVTGVAGIGDWVVIIERDGKKLRWKSLPDGRPTIYEIAFKVGDNVTGKALTPGSVLGVGHGD